MRSPKRSIEAHARAARGHMGICKTGTCSPVSPVEPLSPVDPVAPAREGGYENRYDIHNSSRKGCLGVIWECHR